MSGGRGVRVLRACIGASPYIRSTANTIEFCQFWHKSTDWLGRSCHYSGSIVITGNLSGSFHLVSDSFDTSG